MALSPTTPDAGAPPSPGLGGFGPESFGVVGFGRMAQALLLPLIDGGLVPASGVRAVVGTAASAARLAAHTTALVMLSEVLFASVSSVMLGASQWETRTLVGGALILLAALLSVVGSGHKTD